jgi:homoserine kinase
MNRREFNLGVTRTLPLALGLGSSALDAVAAAGDEKRLVKEPAQTPI